MLAYTAKLPVVQFCGFLRNAPGTPSFDAVSGLCLLKDFALKLQYIKTPQIKQCIQINGTVKPHK